MQCRIIHFKTNKQINRGVGSCVLQKVKITGAAEGHTDIDKTVTT